MNLHASPSDRERELGDRERTEKVGEEGDKKGRREIIKRKRDDREKGYFLFVWV